MSLYYSSGNSELSISSSEYKSLESLDEYEKLTCDSSIREEIDRFTFAESKNFTGLSKLVANGYKRYLAKTETQSAEEIVREWLDKANSKSFQGGKGHCFYYTDILGEKSPCHWVIDSDHYKEAYPSRKVRTALKATSCTLTISSISCAQICCTTYLELSAWDYIYIFILHRLQSIANMTSVGRCLELLEQYEEVTGNVDMRKQLDGLSFNETVRNMKRMNENIRNGYRWFFRKTYSKEPEKVVDEWLECVKLTATNAVGFPFKCYYKPLNEGTTGTTGNEVVSVSLYINENDYDKVYPTKLIRHAFLSIDGYYTLDELNQQTI